jgi:Nuclease-related domain
MATAGTAARGSTTVQDRELRENHGRVEGFARRSALNMGAGAALNPSAFAPRRVGLRERIGELLPNTKEIGGDADVRLERYLRDSDAVILHRCRVSGKRGKISHIIVGPAGVTVVDSRNYGGRRATVRSGQLLVGNRDRPDLIEGVLEHAARVRNLLADTPYADVDVNAAIARGRVEGSRSIQLVDGSRVTVWGTGQIAGEASRPGPLSPGKVEALASYLADELAA